MTDGTIEAIIRDNMPPIAKKVILAGNEDYTAMVLVWEEGDKTGSNLIHLFDVNGDPISAFEVSEKDVRRGIKVITHMYQAWNGENFHPTRVITVEA